MVPILRKLSMQKQKEIYTYPLFQYPMKIASEISIEVLECFGAFLMLICAFERVKKPPSPHAKHL